MATFAFALPELGESIESGDVVQVLVAVGDHVAAEQSVLEIETDKAVVEVPSPVDGSVTALHVAAGDKAAVGQLIVTLETDGATAAEDARPVAAAPPAAEPDPAPAAPPPDVPVATPSEVPPPPRPARAGAGTRYRRQHRRGAGIGCRRPGVGGGREALRARATARRTAAISGGGRPGGRSTAGIQPLGRGRAPSHEHRAPPHRRPDGAHLGDGAAGDAV